MIMTSGWGLQQRPTSPITKKYSTLKIKIDNEAVVAVIAKILLAPQLHACDTFLAAADAEFLQACHGVAMSFSICPMTLEMSHFTYLFSLRKQYWLKCYCQQAVREAATICPHPCKLTFDLLTLKVMSESHVTWATSVPILVFLSLSVLDLGAIRDRRQTRIIA